MRALSFTQPWATLAALKIKLVETRSWPHHGSQQIAIHAAKGQPKWAREFEEELIQRGILKAPTPKAAILAITMIQGCERTEAVAENLKPLELELGDYAPGRWAWWMTQTLELEEPIPCLGKLGLWHIPPEQLLKIHSQIRARRDG